MFEKAEQAGLTEYVKDWFRNNPDKLEKDVKIVIEL